MAFLLLFVHRNLLFEMASSREKSTYFLRQKEQSWHLIKKLKGDLRRVFTTVSFYDLAGVWSMQDFQASFSSTVDGRNPAPPGM